MWRCVPGEIASGDIVKIVAPLARVFPGAG
jgi:hypothetical protein